MHKNTYITLYEYIYISLSIKKECVIIVKFVTLYVQRQVIIMYGRVYIYALVKHNRKKNFIYYRSNMSNIYINNP